VHRLGLIAAFLGIVVIKLVIFWAIASLLLSAGKSFTGNCNTNYKIEAVLAGDWLCPV